MGQSSWIMTKAWDKGIFKNKRSVRHAQVHLHLLCKHTFLLLFCTVIPLLHARTNFLSAHLSLLCCLHWPDVCVIKFIRTCSLLISPPCLSYMIVTCACLCTSHPPFLSFFSLQVSWLHPNPVNIFSTLECVAVSHNKLKSIFLFTFLVTSARFCHWIHQHALFPKQKKLW